VSHTKISGDARLRDSRESEGGFLNSKL